MFEVILIVSGSGERRLLGRVATADEAHDIVSDLDERFRQWEIDGFPAVPQDDPLSVYEGCDIEIADLETGVVTEVE